MIFSISAPGAYHPVVCKRSAASSERSGDMAFADDLRTLFLFRHKKPHSVIGIPKVFRFRPTLGCASPECGFYKYLISLARFFLRTETSENNSRTRCFLSGKEILFRVGLAFVITNYLKGFFSALFSDFSIDVRFSYIEGCLTQSQTDFPP